MHVVILTNMYPTPARPVYGIFVKDQVDDLRELGVEVSVHFIDGSVHRRNYFSAAARMQRLVSQGGIDLVHAHYGLTGAVALAQHRVPVVTTFHGSDSSGHVQWQRVVSLLVARRSTPIFVSPHLAERLHIADPIVIPTAVDTELFRPLERSEARRALGWPSDSRYALLPGARGNAVKRADLFDAALAHARSEIPSLQGVSLEGLCREEVALVMNAVDVTVMTSDSEGSPLTVRESLACCTPVVSVPVGDVATQLEGLEGCAHRRTPARGDRRRRGQGAPGRPSSVASGPGGRVLPPRDGEEGAQGVHERPDRMRTRMTARRLCMVVHSSIPADPRVMAQVRAAREGGWDVDVVALQEPAQPKLETLDGDVQVHRLPVVHRRGSALGAVVGEYLSFTTRAAWKAGALHAGRPYDVVEVHNPPDFLVLAGLAPRLRGAAVLLDIHDLAPDMFDSRFGGRRGAAAADKVLRVVERAATRFANHVLTVHEPYREELISRGVPSDRITVVMNSVDERLLPEPPRARSDGFRVVYHGTVTPHYGIELLVGAAAEAAKSVPDLRLEVYGGGDAVEAAVARADRLGFGDRLTVVSRLSRQDVLEAVSGASVGVVPNLPTRLNRFALSTKLFEYVALGIPAVVSDLETLRMYFGDGEVLFFRAGDEQALARALVEVAVSPEAARGRAAEALRRYEDYRWERNAERYRAVLDALAPDPTSLSGRASAARLCAEWLTCGGRPGCGARPGRGGCLRRRRPGGPGRRP